jgi:ABC-type Na+ efflux pump permease subunit
MFNYRIIGLLKRELKEKLLSKTFIIMTLAIPALMILIIGLQALLFSYEGDTNTKIDIVTESPQLTSSFEKEFSELPFVKDGSYTLNFITKSKQEINNYIEERKKDLLNEKLTGIIFISDSSISDNYHKIKRVY